jgi:hypothetical protein
MRAAPLLVVAALGCAGFGGMGGHHHGGGGGCVATTYLSDDFSSGALSSWNTLGGSPTISNTVGNPPPSALMANTAAMQDIPNLASFCGLRIAADIMEDSGIALMKVVIPGVAKIAVLQVLDTVTYYVLCNGSGCSHATESHVPDNSWHRYKFVIDTVTFDGFWYKDGDVKYTVSAVGSYNSLRVNLGAFPADTAGLGPSLAYFDNVVLSSP